MVLTMKFIIGKEIIYVNNEEGKMIVEARIPFIKESVIDVVRTFVDPSLRGQGVAGKLMEEVYKHAKENNYTVVNTCPYAVNWFAKHPEKADVLNTEIETSPACSIA